MCMVCLNVHILALKRMYNANLSKRQVLGWTLFMSGDEVSSRNPTIPNELSKIGWRMNALHHLRFGIR